MSRIIPEPLINYFKGFIDEGRQATGDKLYRYARPAESAYWVAHRGYDTQNSEYRKMSTTLFPILDISALTRDRPLLITFSSTLFDYAKAVAYGYRYDQVSGDTLVTREYELAVYRNDVAFVAIMYVDTARIIRNVEVLETEYKRAKTLPIYLHDRTYTRYNYTLMPSRLLTKYLAITLVISNDYKMRDAFAYAWNDYWYSLNKLAGDPKYTYIESNYTREKFYDTYSYDDLRTLCYYTFVPERVCYELQTEVERELKDLYSLVGKEIELVSTSHYKPIEYSIDLDVKWWFADRKSLLRDLEYVKRMSAYMPTISAEMDLDAIKEDWWA
jgi:hypothetical protein